jgi:hypothetical protein
MFVRNAAAPDHCRECLRSPGIGTVTCVKCDGLVVGDIKTVAQKKYCSSCRYSRNAKRSTCLVCGKPSGTNKTCSYACANINKQRTYDIFGVKMSVAEVAEVFAIRHQTAAARLRRGWPAVRLRCLFAQPA